MSSNLTFQPDYDKTITRIIDILKNDINISKVVKEFRFGELPERSIANNYPAIYVATADTPEASRINKYGATTPDTVPAQLVETEYWIVILTGPQGDAPTAQKELFKITNYCMQALSRNQTLRNPLTDTATNNTALCNYLKLMSVRRWTILRGKPFDAMTVSCKVAQIWSSPRDYRQPSP